jgi:Arc/MetJ-type ribon-helix-helix transcriptional regulator
VFIDDDFVFEVELVKQVEVNVDYVLMLVERWRQRRSSPRPGVIAARAMGMVFGMATTQKVTVTLRKTTVAAVRDLIAAGDADSVSGFVQHAVQLALDDIAGWGTMLDQALGETGGPLTAAERSWASDALGVGNKSA